MKYTFKSIFDPTKEFKIETDIVLTNFNTFNVIISKVDNEKKSYAEDNINCILKYSDCNINKSYEMDLDSSNFDGYYGTLEKFKKRNCLTMGEPIQLCFVGTYKTENKLTINNATLEMKERFQQFITDNKIMETLFNCFLEGISYERENSPRK